MYWDKLDQIKGGFDFSNFTRNTNLNLDPKKKNITKTGTTLVGLTFKDGVILASDTRATQHHVADPNCVKVLYIAPNIWCAGAGTAADCDAVKREMSSLLALHRLNTGTESRISMLEARLKHKLIQYGGALGCHLIIGGIDVNGPQVITVSSHGSSHRYNFNAEGSGCLAAIGVLEMNYRENMDESEAKELAANAIEAGIFGDLASGSNVDLTIIKKGSVENIRGYRIYNIDYKEEPVKKYQANATETIGETISYNWKNLQVAEVELMDDN